MHAMSSSDEEVTRLEEAADWLQVLSSGPPEDAVLESWLEWCGRDPRNQQAFDGIVAVWGASANLPAAARSAARVTDSAPGKRRTGPTLAAALAASIVTVTCVLGWVALRDTAGDDGQAIASPLGVNSTSRLPDGSIMELGGRTTARLNFSDAERRVQVTDGEIYLTVAKDAQRPFVVDAGPVRVTAVGTAFNVRRTDRGVIVTVGEGIVEAARAAGSTRPCAVAEACVRLTAGQQLSYLDSGKSFTVTSVNPAIAASWRSGMLKFVDEPLSTVLSSVNRYSHRPIQFRDSAVGELSFTGTVHVEHIDGWLKALESAFPLSVVDSGAEGVLLASRR